uniref:Proteasome activator complex subunit 2 n=1 Tax=Nothobranchius furzeri TaxID=105023 RepID=A0A8C6PBR2_NOTFU
MNSSPIKKSSSDKWKVLSLRRMLSSGFNIAGARTTFISGRRKPMGLRTSGISSRLIESKLRGNKISQATKKKTFFPSSAAAGQKILLISADLFISSHILKVSIAMSKAATLKISSASSVKVENFCQSLYQEAENLFSSFVPQKIIQLDALLRDDALSITDMSSLQAPLDIPIPDPPSPEDEEMETDKNGDDEKKKKKAPKCGFIKGNEKIMILLDRVKPEIVCLRETIIVVSSWIQHLIPKIEDGNDFGVAIQVGFCLRSHYDHRFNARLNSASLFQPQEKILERITAVKTKVDGFQTNINKYFSERGDAVAKASKDTHVMDYRSLVHEKDGAAYSDIRVIVLDIRGFYAELYDIINKNLEKVINPKGEEKPSMY